MNVLAPFIESLDSSDLQKVSESLLKLNPELVGCNNWKDQYPETPKTYVRVAHNNKEIFVRFDVDERYTMAHVEKDNGEVWYDSACEFFISFDELGYYNIEMTCIGKVLIGFQKELKDQVLGPTESIKRFASLGDKTFDEKVGDNKWFITYALPLSVFWRHNLTSLHGMKARCNFYKIGDGLTKQHYLSWSPITNPNPFFHMPEFFGTIDFE